MLFIVGIVVVHYGTLNYYTNDRVMYEVFISGSRGGPLRSVENKVGVLGVGFDEIRVEEKTQSPIVFEGGALFGNEIITGEAVKTESNLTYYRVRKGDTITSLTEKFSIDNATLRAANPTLSRTLRVGSTLTILPISGILYEVREGDSLESITAQFSLDRNLLVRYNPEYQKIILEGKGALVLPHVKPGTVPTTLMRRASLPNIPNYFTLPVRGWNWGELHDENAIDIANKCGSPVYAAAEGLVVPDQELGDGAVGWNDGYGIFVLVEHPNKTKTRYAHLTKALVRPGDYISRSNQIGLMGNTGNTHGPTGCHLHFEVLGAKNPFAVR